VACSACRAVVYTAALAANALTGGTHKAECKESAKSVSESALVAAKRGTAMPQLNVGFCYMLKGYGAVKNAQQALSWYRRAAQSG